MSNSSLALLLLLALFATFTTSFSRYIAHETNKLDDGSSNSKVGLRLLLQSDSTPPPPEDYSEGPTSTETGNNAYGPTSDTDTGTHTTDPGTHSTYPGTHSTDPSSNADSNSNPTGPSPPASDSSHKLTIILGTSVPTSVILSTILGILGRRCYKKRKSARAGKTGHSNTSYVAPVALGKDVVVEVAVNFVGAAKK